MRAYRRLSPHERLEVHVVLGFVTHETTHKVDLLISPFGVQYLALLIKEYQLLQEIMPRLLDERYFKTGFPILALADQIPPSVMGNGALLSLWNEFRPYLLRAVAWGDMGDVRPDASKITIGWPGLAPPAGPYFKTSDTIELIVVNKIFCSFRLEGAGNKYVRPTSILETKALAGTLLRLLDIVPDSRDMSQYYEAVYGAHQEGLQHDYLLTIDIIARMHGSPNFGALLAKANRSRIRHLLLITQAVCWFALHGSPIPQGHVGTGGLSGNPVVRLFTALSHLPQALQEEEKTEALTSAALLSRLERYPLFRGLDQLPVHEAVDAAHFTLGQLEHEVTLIWNPEVREHFRRVIGIMRPHFADRRDHYGLALGQPDNGNARDFAHTEASMELFFHDHEPHGGYREWLTLRPKILFSRHVPRDEVFNTLHKHFHARYEGIVCSDRHTVFNLWTSRFARETYIKCPACQRILVIGVSETFELTLQGIDGDDNHSILPIPEDLYRRAKEAD